MAYLKDQLLTYGYAVSPSNATPGVGRDRTLSRHSSESNTEHLHTTFPIASSTSYTHTTTPFASGSYLALVKPSTPISNVNMEPLVLKKVLPSPLGTYNSYPPSPTPSVSKRTAITPRQSSAITARRGLVVSVSTHSQSDTMLPSPSSFRDLKEDDSNYGSGTTRPCSSMDSLSHIPTSDMPTPRPR